MHLLVLVHVVPFAAFCVTQLPVVGSQTLTLHESVLAGQVFAVPPWQVPLLQVWPVLQRSVLHGVVFGAFCSTQLPVVGSQTLTLQGVVVVQVLGVPPWQVPLLQVWPVLQRSALHGVVFGAFCVTQMPVAGAHTLTLHGSLSGGHCTCWPVDLQSPFWHVSNVHRSLSLLHVVPSVLNWLGGHCAELPVQNSATSH